jgi:hypothetical protein
MRKINKIKIFGERNTGTRYLQKLIELNFNMNILSGSLDKYKFLLKILNKIKINQEFMRDIYFKYSTKKYLGWKHREVDHFEIIKKKTDLNEILFLVIVKNPYSFLLSLKEKPYHNPSYKWLGLKDLIEEFKSIDFNDFLKNEWLTVGREADRTFYENPIQMWNLKCASYLKLQSKYKCSLIRYEDLLDNPELVISRISKEHKIPFNNVNFKNYNKSTKDPKKDTEFYKKKYGKELWKEKLTKEHINFINKHLDKELMETFGYKLL